LQFVPQSLEYLKRGGRMSHIQMAIASVLQIKPVFLFKDNNLSVAKKTIGMHLAINELVSRIPQNVKKLFALHIGDENVFFESFVKKIKEKFSEIVVKISNISPVVGVHVGPGTIGFASITE
ncbi:hypothetical protein EOM81_13115, partial [bacterium]|nr:hypothetical protein [bacterium]